VSAYNVTVKRVLLSAALWLVLGLPSWPARALPTSAEKQVCADSAEAAQTLRARQALVEARQALQRCARDSCPDIVRRDCREWLAQVESELPSVVFVVRDAHGVSLTDAQIRVDDLDTRAAVPGHPLALDPGAHRVRVSRAGHAALDTRFVVYPGERQRRIDLVLRDAVRSPPRAAPARVPESARHAEPGRPLSPWVIGLGGVGIAGLSGFAYLALSGRSDVEDLRNTCAPYCAQSDIDAARRKLLLGDVALAVGLGALGAATVVYFMTPRSPAAGAFVAAASGGAVSGVAGRF
jgi:hypothetical protein